MPSIDATVAQVDDVRRSQGRKPCMASVLSVGLLFRLMGHKGPVAAAELVACLGQKDLAAIGSWKNTVTGRHEPVSGSTLHRVMQTLGSEQMQAVLQHHGQPRLHIACETGRDGPGSRVDLIGKAHDRILDWAIAFHDAQPPLQNGKRGRKNAASGTPSPSVSRHTRTEVCGASPTCEFPSRTMRPSMICEW